MPEEAEQRDGKAEEGPEQQKHADPGRGWCVHGEGDLPRHLKAPPNLPPIPCESSLCQAPAASCLRTALDLSIEAVTRSVPVLLWLWHQAEHCMRTWVHC